MKQRGSNGAHLNTSKKIACCRSQSDAAHYKFLSDCHALLCSAPLLMTRQAKLRTKNIGSALPKNLKKIVSLHNLVCNVYKFSVI